MIHDFDIIVIGSGPAAFAAIDAMDGGLSVACITGAIPVTVKRSRLHPKIMAVSSTRNEPPGIAEVLQQKAGAGQDLFSTATVGGLANYWGQQFIVAQSNDPWPRDFFENYSDYLAECRQISSHFNMEGGQTLENDVVTANGFSAGTPLLMTGASSSPALTEMRQTFLASAKAKRVALIEARAHSFEPSHGRWTVVLDNGDKVTAGAIALAAGVVGNARLLMRTYGDLTKASFLDHTPWMLQTIGLRPLFKTQRSANNHFNATSLEKTGNESSEAFASVYNMRYADLNLLLAATVGYTSRIFSGIMPPAAASLLKPIQVWTKSTTDRVDIHHDRNSFFYAAPSSVSLLPDDALDAIVSLVKALRGRILSTSRTAPGFGFHYHSLELQSDAQPMIPVSSLLGDRTGDGVFCVDGSILESIGCRPPTLTAMATARRITRRRLHREDGIKQRTERPL